MVKSSWLTRDGYSHFVLRINSNDNLDIVMVTSPWTSFASLFLFYSSAQIYFTLLARFPFTQAAPACAANSPRHSPASRRRSRWDWRPDSRDRACDVCARPRTYNTSCSRSCPHGKICDCPPRRTSLRSLRKWLMKINSDSFKIK